LKKKEEESLQKKPACCAGAGRVSRRPPAGGPWQKARRKSKAAALSARPLARRRSTDGPMRPSGTCRNPHPAAGVGLAVAGLPAAAGPCPPDSR